MSETKIIGRHHMSRRSLVGLGLGAFVVTASGIPHFLLSDTADRAWAQEDVAKFMKPGAMPENAMGSEDAPVTIVEYSSLTCPHCANFHQHTVPGLKEKYVKTGKVRYIIREFPLDRIAFAAAALARCAGPDKFFPFVSALYKSQATWARGEGNPAERLFKMAQQAGFTKDTFNACLRNKEVIDHIEATRKRGNEDFGVNSTPTVFVNGKKLEGGNSLADLEKAMEPYLGG
ncbi:MAG: DsbA family protein [Hyphomicrobiaceae bacterium]|nr:DsbA family protein [Hyphomicrobiaceae bacterium]